MTKRARTAPGSRPPARPSPSWADRQDPALWSLAGLVALGVLLWACRGASLGVPVADDYAFLDRLRFQHPLDPFDSMGAAYYWRPLSRQAYYSLLGPSLLAAPWVASTLHGVLLLALFGVLLGIARRMVPAPAAAAIAVFPVLSESARVLLGWPSGAQHLLAMLLAAFAVHEALAGRWAIAGLSAAGGVLSHESAAIVLPLLPILAYARARRPVDAWRAGVISALVLGLWAGGYTIARGHGVALPRGGGAIFARLPELFVRALTAQLNLEDLDDFVRGPLVVGYALVFAWAAALLFTRRARERVRGRSAVLGGALLWFVLGSLPLAVLLPDWNSWRGSVPGLGFGLFATGLLALASSELALAFAALRLVALLCSAPVQAQLTRDPPPTATDMSFVRLARLQSIVNATRRALVGRHPTLPHGADVRFWWGPTMAEVGFQGPRAVRVWYADSTMTWRGYGGRPGAPGVDAVIEYDLYKRWSVVAIEPEAVRLIGDAQHALEAGRLDEGDSLVAAGHRAQRRDAPEYFAAGDLMMASSALTRGDLARADSLNEHYAQIVGPRSRYYGMKAAIALMAGRRDDGLRAVAECLRLDSTDEVGLRVKSALEAGKPAPVIRP